MSRDLITSTMKSEPVRSAVRISAGDNPRSSPSVDIGIAPGVPVMGTGEGDAAAGVAITAAPAATFLRKSRRLTEFFLRRPIPGASPVNATLFQARRQRTRSVFLIP